MTHPLGFLWQLAWANPYTDPPSGQPRLLAEIYVPCDYPGQGASKRPANLLALHKLGSGYSVSSRAIMPAPRQLSTEALASTRQKRLRNRMEKQAPLLADQLYADELAAKSDYYAGITDADLQAARDRTLAGEDAERQRLLANPNRLFIYTEPSQPSSHQPCPGQNLLASASASHRAPLEDRLYQGAPPPG